MRFLNFLAGVLLGAVPGLVVLAIGQIVTDGGDGMILFGMGGVALIFVGLIVGGAWGWKSDGWLSGHSVLGAVVGLACAPAPSGELGLRRGSLRGDHRNGRPEDRIDQTSENR
jgi:hypothetical protein